MEARQHRSFAVEGGDVPVLASCISKGWSLSPRILTRTFRSVFRPRIFLMPSYDMYPINLCAGWSSVLYTVLAPSNRFPFRLRFVVFNSF